MKELDIMDIVRANIVSKLEARQWRPADLQARVPNMSATAVYDLISGKSPDPRVKTLQKIASGFDEPITSLFVRPGRAEIMEKLNKVLTEMPEDEAVKLLAMARVLTDPSA